MRPVCEISPEIPFDCLEIIHKKIRRKELTKKELSLIIDAIYCDRLSDIHIAGFLIACAVSPLSNQEIIYLTQAMINIGQKIKWDRKVVVDKHCVGGVAGNRTSPIIVSIIASTGLYIPKISTQAITSPAGTADTMGVLTNVELSIDQIRTVVEKTSGCLAWGGHTNISPVDDLLTHIERQLDLDYDSQLVASILSKNIAVGATHVLIDIPVGKGIKVKTKKHALTLKSYFENISRAFNINTEVIITEGTKPIGKGIGPALEAKDILYVLKNDHRAPEDLINKACTMANKVFKMVNAKEDAYEILRSGKAWEKFQEICMAQGGPIKDIPEANFQYVLCATNNMQIKKISNHHIVNISKLAGAPKYVESGVYLHVNVKDTVKSGQPLLTIYGHSQEHLDEAVLYATQYLKWTS